MGVELPDERLCGEPGNSVFVFHVNVKSRGFEKQIRMNSNAWKIDIISKGGEYIF